MFIGTKKKYPIAIKKMEKEMISGKTHFKDQQRSRTSQTKLGLGNFVIVGALMVKEAPAYCDPILFNEVEEASPSTSVLRLSFLFELFLSALTEAAEL